MVILYVLLELEVIEVVLSLNHKVFLKWSPLIILLLGSQRVRATFTVYGAGR